MKTMILTALLFSASFSQAATIRDAKNAAQLMQVLSEMASGGSSLMMFTYGENQRAPARATCKDMSAENVLVHAYETIKQVREAGEQTLPKAKLDALVLKAMPELKALIGAGPYRVCVANQFGGRADERISHYQSARYVFTLTTAWED